MPDLYPIVRTSIVAAIVALAAAALLSMLGKRREANYALIGYFLLCCIFFGVRAYMKQFFPFTDKVESFTTLGFLIAGCAVLYRDKVSNKEFCALLLLALSSASAIFVFEDKVKYPTAYLLTFWYPLHVPLSFAAYAFWFLAGINSLFSLRLKLPPEGEERQRALVNDLNRYGFILFSLAMLFGGIWGYLAWGAYFMWDPKLLWSVILWIYYGNLLHIDALPKLRRWRTPLYLLGMVLILITFIGTGFFTRSIHKF